MAMTEYLEAWTMSLKNNAMPSRARIGLCMSAPFPSVEGKAEGVHRNVVVSLGTYHVFIKAKRVTEF